MCYVIGVLRGRIPTFRSLVSEKRITILKRNVVQNMVRMMFLTIFDPEKSFYGPY